MREHPVESLKRRDVDVGVDVDDGGFTEPSREVGRERDVKETSLEEALIAIEVLTEALDNKVGPMCVEHPWNPTSALNLAWLLRRQTRKRVEPEQLRFRILSTEIVERVTKEDAKSVQVHATAICAAGPGWRNSELPHRTDGIRDQRPPHAYAAACITGGARVGAQFLYNFGRHSSLQGIKLSHHLVVALEVERAPQLVNALAQLRQLSLKRDISF